MPRKLAAAERAILIINRRARRLGGWNAAVIMASISVANRRKKDATIQDLADATQLSVGVIHRTIERLVVAGLVEIDRRQNKFSRRLSLEGVGKLRRICRF